MACWSWCTRDHVHDYGSTRPSLHVRPDTIPAEERRRLADQLPPDLHFEKRSDLDRRMSERGLRFLDPGEPGDKMRRDVKTWVESGGESCGVPAPAMHEYVPRRRNPVDIRAIFRENLERARAKYGRQ